MDFQDDKNNQEDAAVDTSSHKDKAGEAKGKERKKKKKRRHSHIEDGENNLAAIEDAYQKSASPNSKAKRSAKEEAREKKGGYTEHKAAKKRKREGEDKARMPSTGNFVIGADMASNVQRSMGDIGAMFTNLTQPPNNAQPKTLKNTKKNKNDVMEGSVGQTENLVNATMTNGISAVEDPRLKRHKAKSGHGAKNGGKSTKPKAPPSTSKSPFVTVPRKSHVPLPPKSQVVQKSSFTVLGKGMEQTEGSEDSDELMIPETPPTGQTNSSSNNLSLETSFSKALKAAILPSHKQPPTPTISSQESRQGDVMLESTSPLNKQHHGGSVHNGRLEKDVLPKHVEKILNVQSMHAHPHPKQDSPHPSGVSSTGTSLPSSSISSKLPAAFDRVGMPYARSGAGTDPFTTTSPITKKKHRETHEEAPVALFTATFLCVQRTVNFSDEQDYMSLYFERRAANEAAGPYPCLRNATGCTPKKESIIALAAPDGKPIARFQDAGHNPASMLDTTLRFARAEEFLATATRARVPVPLGRIKGTWTLFCPKYAEHHFDRYSLGQRTLTIYAVAGTSEESSFTARLSIPPRSISFVIRPFGAPPHASFRSTVLSTAPEGYKVQIAFLGNGYALVRLDLSLLLQGKRTAEGEGGGMEFLASHEKALAWVDERDEVEEVGRKLFAKYGGGEGDGE